MKGDAYQWSVQIGRFRQWPVRVHVTFVAAAVFIYYLASLGTTEDGWLLGLLSVAVLFATVLLHELGHGLAAARVGAPGEIIVIGPLGGLGSFDVPREPHAELIVLLAGPLVNLALLLLTLPVLLAAQIELSNLLSPWQPTGLLEGPWWHVCLKLTFWMNWLVLACNLLPAFPLDGAKILRTMLWPAVDYRTAAQIAVRASKVTAVMLCVVAWYLADPESTEAMPARIPLLLLAVFCYFSARQESSGIEDAIWDEDALGYDFSQGYTSLERTMEPPHNDMGPVRRWLNNRRELRIKRQRTQEADEERQVDDILVRLHEKGMSGLSAKERALLNRVSARYRSRHSH